MALLSKLPARLNPFLLNAASSASADLTERLNDLKWRYEKYLANRISGGDFESRYFKALSFVLPFLDTHLPAKRLNALEIGCGKGAKSFPLSLLFDDYYGFDIVKEEIDFARSVQASLGLSGVHFLVDEAANLKEFLTRTNVRFDLIILYAILEHLTIKEKIELLSLCWSYLDLGGVLLIGEAPNRMFPIDYHSTKSLYFQQMPFPLWPRYVHRVPNKRWGDIISRAAAAGDLQHRAFRHGVHIGHQEFDLAMGSVEELNNHIVADSYAAEMLNLYPYESIEFLKYVELLGLRAFPSGVALEPRKFPHFFSRYYLEVLLKKGSGSRSRDSLSVRFDEYGDHEALAGRLEHARRVRKREKVRVECGLPSMPADRKVSVVLGFREPMLSGAVRVTDAAGRVVYESDLRELVLAIARWRRNIAVRLGDMKTGDFPLTVEAMDGNGVSLRYSVVRPI